MQKKHVEQQRSFLTSMKLMDFVYFVAHGFDDCTVGLIADRRCWCKEPVSRLLDWTNDFAMGSQIISIYFCYV
jgi:hypothetical protein